jgi:CheY-like chemotaxis protein
LLEDTTLLAHRDDSHLSEAARELLRQSSRSDRLLAGKKVLIVDDDVRNLFALTSLLERQRMRVISAENGSDGILTLQQNPDVDVVLMDVMMPGIDGYETTRLIRQQPAFAALPIVSLTAKAMKGDRDKSLAAGASDYITKPVDTEQLLSLLRVWLS